MSPTLSDKHQGEAMAYICELSTGQTVYLDNQGSQTLLVVSLSSPGQQQQSSSSFQTGAWTSPPCVFQTGQGLLLRITTAHGESYIQIQGNSMSLMVGSPNTASFTQVALREGAFPSASGNSANGMDAMPDMEPMQPMQPMQPMGGMQMGDMQMNMKPMQMRMGDMAMSMGHAHSNGGHHVSTNVNRQQQAQATSTPTNPRRFCNQCGTGVGLSDRFCSSCGNSLQ